MGRRPAHRRKPAPAQVPKPPSVTSAETLEATVRNEHLDAGARHRMDIEGTACGRVPSRQSDERQPSSRLTVFPSRYRFSLGNKKAPDKYDTPAVRDKDNLGSGTMRCHNCHNDRNNEMAQAESVTPTRERPRQRKAPAGS